ncbi:hypothetical protein SUGI_0138980 [Cryptomeria japonica]|nr:hypothetical protein SUGI_0138980 [Cryptomeria japonica]
MDRRHSGEPSTSGRAPPRQEQPWQTVKSRRTQMMERRENWSSNEIRPNSRLWVTPITSWTPPFVSGANRTELGHRNSNHSQYWHGSRPFQNRFQPLNHAEGFLKPARGRGFQNEVRFKNSMNNCKQKTNANYQTRLPKNLRAPRAASNQTSQNPRIKADAPIVITEKIHSKTPKLLFQTQHFHQMERQRNPSSVIAEWWEDNFTDQVDQVGITRLPNDFINLECYKESLKEELLHGDFVFHKGFNFKFIDWHPKFDAKMYKTDRISRWVILRNVPVEFMHAQIFFEIGDRLGGFLGLEEDWLNTTDVKILIDMDAKAMNLSPISFETSDDKYSLLPEFYSGPISENIMPRTRRRIQSKETQQVPRKEYQQKGNKINKSLSHPVEKSYSQKQNNAEKAQTCSLDEHIQREYDDVINKVVGKIAEEIVEDAEVENKELNAQLGGNQITTTNDEAEQGTVSPERDDQEKIGLNQVEVVKDTPMDMDDTSPVIFK